MAIGCMLLVLQPHVADFTFAANCMWACVCVCKGGEGGRREGACKCAYAFYVRAYVCETCVCVSARPPGANCRILVLSSLQQYYY